MNVANFLAQYLKSQECSFVFGMPGGASLPVLEALREEGINFILVRQEASAGFMADGVFQRTGKLSACLATLGPGVTNLVSGIAQAYTERSRVLGIVSQIGSQLYPIYTHQIIDQKSIFDAICHGYFQIHPHRPAEQLRKMARCVDAQLGPVIIELTKDVANAPCLPLRLDSPPQAGVPDTTNIRAALEESQRPLLFVGAEDLSFECCLALRELATSHNIPVLTTYRAKGLFPEDALFSLGTCGLSPVVDDIQQRLIDTADLLICVGLDPVELRPNWLPGWSPELRVINISEQGQPDLLCSFDADLRGNIPKLLWKLKDYQFSACWELQAIERHKKTIEDIFAGDENNPATAIGVLQQGLPDNAILCLDVGSHRITASHVWKALRPRMILQSNGFSSMGVGVPYGIACALLEPDTPVVVLTGDMGLGMSLGEFGLIQEHRLNIIVVYLADNALSLIELKQERDNLPNFGVRFENPDPLALAQAFGGRGWRCTDANELAILLETEDVLSGFHLIEVQIDPRGYRDQM